MSNEATSLMNSAKMKQRIMNMIRSEMLQQYKQDDLLSQRNDASAIQKRNLAGSSEFASFGGNTGTTVGQ